MAQVLAPYTILFLYGTRITLNNMQIRNLACIHEVGKGRSGRGSCGTLIALHSESPVVTSQSELL